ncbi:MAG: hypothetical protein ACKOI2_09745 [Actinomycetota bacterium]
MRLITTGALPAERIGNRHRLLLDDILAPPRRTPRRKHSDPLERT